MGTITDPLTHTTMFGFDAAGNRTSITAALNHPTSVALQHGLYKSWHLAMKLIPAIVITVVLAHGVSRQTNSLDDALVVKLSFIHDAVALDGLIEPEIAFVNVGNESFYVERSDSIGPRHIEIVVNDATCKYTDLLNY